MWPSSADRITQEIAMLTALAHTHFPSLLSPGFSVSFEWAPLAEWCFGAYHSDDLSVVYLGAFSVCVEWLD